jgi:hypothetical protein
MNLMKTPGFTAESALAAGRGSWRARAKALTDDRTSVLMARTKVSGPGGSQCELDAILTVEEGGGTSTTNIWKCTTTVDIGSGGDPRAPVDGGSGSGGGGGGSGSGGTPPKKEKYDPSEGGLCRAQSEGGTIINTGQYHYESLRDDFDCCGPRIYKDGQFYRQDCVACRDDVKRCQNR